jgi:hypothetical protein
MRSGLLGRPKANFQNLSPQVEWEIVTFCQVAMKMTLDSNFSGGMKEH